jgi:cytochrome P450
MAQSAVAFELGATNAPLPPIVRGLPLIGSLREMTGDILAHMVKWYDRYGSVYRVRVVNREFYVIAGLEANHLYSRHSEDLFTSEDTYQPLVDRLNSDILMTYLSGEEHKYMRKTLRPVFSREMLSVNYELLVKLTYDHLAQWKKAPRVQVMSSLQRLVTDQLGMSISGRVLNETFEPMRVYSQMIVGVIAGFAHKRVLKSRKFLEAEEQVNEFLHRLLEDRRGQPAKGDLVDLILNITRMDGSPLSEYDQLALSISAYIAGIDTLASTLSFALYGLLKNPEALATVKAEIAPFFKDGTPSLGALKDMHALHGAAVETMRMYPIAPVVPRTANQSFTFAGHQIPKGASVFIAHGVTHYSEQYFPEPTRYRLDRNIRSAPAGAYAPFSLGAHTCLGAGLAEGLMMLTLAIILHDSKLSLSPANYQAKITPTPTPNPGLGLYVKVE